MGNFNDEFLYRYLKKAKVPYTKKEVDSLLLNHPSSPSLRAVSDTLEALKVRTMAVGLITADLNEVDFPVIVHLKKGHGEFVLLESKKQDMVKYFQRGKLIEENLEAFEKKWSGTTLLLEPPENSAKEDLKSYYWNKYGKLTISLLAALMLLIIAAVGISSASLKFGIYLSGLLLLNLSGLGLSFYLYKIHLDKSAQNGKFCKKTKTVDCTAVLFSKWSRLFGLFNWAQLGIVHFFGQSLCLLFGLINLELLEPSLFLLSIITLLAGVFSLYSIFLQAFVIRKWCSLCLASQGIILVNIGLNIYQDSTYDLGFTSVSLIVISFSYLFGLMVSLDYTSRYELQSDFKEKAVQLAKFKGDEIVFESLLKRQRKAPDYSSLKGVISMGSECAPNEILMVASLYCEPCKIAYKQLTGLLKKHPDKVSLKIIFTLDRTTSRPEEIPVNIRLIELASSANEKSMAKAIDSWFETIVEPLGESRWLEENMIERSLNKAILTSRLETHQKWLGEAMIYKTPTVFFNKYELPQIYLDLENLKYILS